MKLFSLIFIFIFCANNIFCQTIIPTDSIEFSKLKENWNSEYYQNFISKLKSDTLFFKNKQGEFTSQKLLRWLSIAMLNEQIDVYKIMAKRALSKKEYKKFKSLNFVVNENSTLPILSFNEEITFDNKWILQVTLESLIPKLSELNGYERLYYDISSKIEQNMFPDYLGDMFDFNTMDKTFAIAMNLIMLNFFIVMHEYYHIEYDNINTSIIERETKADSFAISKCINLVQTNEIITEKELLETFAIIFNKNGSEIWNETNGKCPNSKILSSKVFLRNLTGAFIGSQFIAILIHQDGNSLLTNPENIILDLERGKKLNEISSSLLNCDNDSDNKLCCAFEIERKKLIENLEFCKPFLNSPLYFRELNISKDTFISINPDNPSYISFQLGSYYYNIKNYKRALEYFQSANLFNDNSPTAVICNLISCDILLNISECNNIELAKVYFNNAKKMNVTYNYIRKEIFDGYNFN